MTGQKKVATSKRPLRILYVVTKANWGGAQRYVFDIATAAQKAGHEVLVVSGMPGKLIEELTRAGIATKIIASMERDIKARNELRAFNELFRIVRYYKPDVLHANSSKAGLLGCLVGRLLGVRRIIFTSHGWAFNEQRPMWQKSIIALVHYLTVVLSHRTICVSFGLQSDASWMPGVQHKFVVVHNGIAAHTQKERGEARQYLASDMQERFPQALWFGTIAELHPTKGLDVLIEAFADATQRGIDAVLVIMGEGQEWMHLSKLIEIYDLPKRVVLAGFVPNAIEYLSAIDAFVLPSRSEGLGYVLLEAGIAKKPVIATRVGGIPEIVEDDETGMLVPKNDRAALSEALYTLANDPDQQKRLSDALYAKVTTQFSLEEMVQKTQEEYS